MLRKAKNIYYQINSISNTDKYKIVVLILLIIAILNSFNYKDGISYEEALLNVFSTNTFLCVTMGTVFISTMLVISFFDKWYGYVIRFKSKREYIFNLSLLVFFMNFITFFIEIVFELSIITIKYTGRISFISFPDYEIPYIIYNCFILFRYFIIITLLSLFGLGIYKSFGEKYSYIFYIAILILFYGMPVSISTIVEFKLENLNFINYLRPLSYDNFFLEILFFIIEFIFLSGILRLFYVYILKRKKININE